LRILESCRQFGAGDEGINVPYMARLLAPEGFSNDQIRYDFLFFLLILLFKVRPLTT
jgi:hypothetical protein